MNKELYTFAEYLQDNIIMKPGYAVNVSANELLASWDMYRQSYISYCKDYGYSWEVIA